MIYVKLKIFPLKKWILYIIIMDTISCDICNKEYKTKKSLWNHKKNIHKNNTHTAETIIKCNFCSTTFSRSDNLKRHLNLCKLKGNIDKNIIDENTKLKTENEELKKLINNLINTNCKMHYKQFNKLQKLLEENNNSVQNTIINGPVNNGSINNGLINNGPVNNGIINNINIIAFGDEKIEQLFTENEKLTVLNEKQNALNFLIEYVHFNEKYPQFHNIIVTNNKANEAYIFDKETRNFKLVKKNNLIDDLIEYRTCDIEEFYYELINNLDEETKEIIETLNKERGDDNATREKVKMLLFNNKEKVKHLLA